jgi:hypothetical protein
MDSFLKMLFGSYMVGGEEGARRFAGGYILVFVILAIVVGIRLLTE